MCFGSGNSKSKGSKAIDKELKNGAKAKMQQHKILLLGTGNSGKSTFCKQLTAKYGGTNPHLQTSNDEVLCSLRDNTLTGMVKLIQETKIRAERESKEWPSESLKDYITHLETVTPQTMTKESVEAIRGLWDDPVLTEILQAYGDQMAIPGGVDGLAYFVEKIENYIDSSYTHTQEDLLRNRIKTTGIVESKFVYGGKEFIICDVAGQRSERRKWIHCFNSVSAVIYLTSVNEYDVGLEEATTQNSFTDSIQQWKVISDLQCFKTTPFMVFFNKFDLLPPKLEKTPLKKIFRDFEAFSQESKATTDVERAVAYFEGVFSKNFGGNTVEFFTTCALDPDSCAKVFESVQRSILSKAMEDSGMLEM